MNMRWMRPANSVGSPRSKSRQIRPEPSRSYQTSPGRSQHPQAMVETRIKGQTLPAAWRSHLPQALVETHAICQTLQAAWQSHLLQTLVEGTAKGQSLQASWQSHLHQAPDEAQAIWLKLMSKVTLCRPLGRATFTKFWLNQEAKGQALQAAWQSQLLQALVEARVKGQTSRPLGGANFSKHWLRLTPQVKLCRSLGRATFSKLWLKAQPKVNLCRPPDRATFTKPRMKLRPFG